MSKEPGYLKIWDVDGLAKLVRAPRASRQLTTGSDGVFTPLTTPLKAVHFQDFKFF